MKQSSGPARKPAEAVIKDIRRATRRQFSAEAKVRLVLEGLRGEDSIAELCEALANGDQVELRGFGAFEVRERGAPSARNLETGEKVAVEARAKAHPKPSTTMQARLNRGEAGTEQEAERFLRAS
jgi:nucleoid DNA-binding protein